jgi:hypothetical protein
MSIEDFVKISDEDSGGGASGGGFISSGDAITGQFSSPRGGGMVTAVSGSQGLTKPIGDSNVADSALSENALFEGSITGKESSLDSMTSSRLPAALESNILEIFDEKLIGPALQIKNTELMQNPPKPLGNLNEAFGVANNLNIKQNIGHSFSMARGEG